MKTPRELAWEEYERVLRSSVAYRYARWTDNLTYDALPPAVVQMAKFTLLDTFAAAIGAYPSAGRVALEKMAQEIGGKEQATVIGSGMRTSASNAMLVNCFMVRQLDYNDLRGGGHNSDSIPSLLATAEAEGSSGRDLITSIVISYELGARVSGSISIPPNSGVAGFGEGRAGLTMPCAIGKLMGLTEDQIANAIGIAALHSQSLSIVDTHNEELRMVRNIRFGIPAHNSYLGCLMAKHGMTGIVRIVEGDGGIRDTLHGHMDLTKMVDFSRWQILDTPWSGNKTLCQDGSTLGAIQATLQVVKEHDLKPEDVQSVTLTVTPRTAAHVTFVPAKKWVRNEESASHSIFFSTAIAIKERNVGPAQLKPDKFDDPVVLDLIDKITVLPDASLHTSVTRWAGISQIRTTDGRTLQHRVDLPHGYVDDMLTDQEIEEKFRDAAGPYLCEEKITALISAVWELDNASAIGDLMRLLVVDK